MSGIAKKRVITKTIFTLSFVSLFTDMASEMLYPIMPVYLKSIGFSIVLIGVLEGFTEALAGLSKGYFGKLSDNTGKRLPFVQLGYLLSAISKPMMAFFTFPFWVFSARAIDRLGKGIRTGARDAMLSDETTPDSKGTVFGFHRSMDTLGVVIGPLLALLYLYYYPQQYKTLFYIAFIPGIIAIGFTLLLRDRQQIPDESQIKTSFFDFLRYWKVSSSQYKRLVLGLLLFSIGNSSDVFLLLKLKESGVSDTVTIGTYIFYNLVYAITACPLGVLADRIGLKKILIFGFIVFSGVYIGMSFNSNFYIFFMLFFFYGIYAASTEGISKAWISNLSPKAIRLLL